MAVPNNYIDKIKKDGDSRMISPAADMVRVDNDNFEGADLDEVLDEVAQAIGEAGEGGYAPPAGGIPKTDLASGVQASLNKADTALQQSDLSGYATTDDVDDAVAALVSSAPQTLDTLKELADALGDDPNFATTMATQLGNKVDKETGKSLMTDAERTKLQGIAAGAEVNVQSDWNQTTTTADDYIKNKPTIPTVDGTINNSQQANPVQGGAIFSALAGKENTLTWDSAPTSSSTNPVTSGGVYTALQSKQDTIIDLSTIRTNSGKGVADISSQEDGTVDIELANGDTCTLDLNHEHEQYLEIEDIDDYVTAGTNVTITKDSQTGVLTISASGGSSGVTDVTMNGSSVVSNGVAQLGTVLTSQTKANWTETNSSSDAYIQNKPSLATVATSGAYSDLSGAPTIPSAAGSNDTPVMDGTAAVGSSSAYAKADHVHPSDTSKANTSEMSVITSGDQTTITLKTGTSATVINQHQSLSGYVQSSGVTNIVVCASESAYNDISPKDSNTLYLIKE